MPSHIPDKSPKQLLVGELLVRNGIISEQNLQSALERQNELQGLGRHKLLGEIIVECGYVTAADIEKVIAAQKNGKPVKERRENGFYRHFVQKVIVAIGKKVAGKNGNSKERKFDKNKILELGRKEFHAAVHKKEEIKHPHIIHTLHSLGVLTYQETKEIIKEVIKELDYEGIIVDYDPKSITVKDGEVYYLNDTSYIRVLPVYYPEPVSDIQLLMGYDECTNISVECLIDLPREKSDLVSFTFKDVVKKALLLKASDIHILPKTEYYRVFFRIDGRFLEMTEFLMNVEQGREFSALIRQEANLNTKGGFNPDESKVSQPAKIEYEDLGVGLRLEFVPDGWTLEHTDTTARLISKVGDKISTNLTSNLKRWGFSDEDIPAFKSMTRMKTGLIVVSGVVGSGKSTTIWEILTTFERTKKVGTVEDPIEYVFDNHNIVQHQIYEPENKDLTMGFEQYIKSFKRGDYDVIFIGEWRKSAGLTNAMLEQANAGQLIFTTLHIQSSFEIYSAINEMFNVPIHVSARMIRMSLNQLLLPKLCKECKIETEIDFGQDDVRYLNSLSKAEKEKLISFKAMGYRKNESGCNKCHYTGVDGRVVIYDYFVPSQELISDIIKEKPSPNDIKSRVLLDQIGKAKLSAFLERIKEGVIDKSCLYEI
jgi:type II secretory ATPase GspE/PulE/Tfp pilus assembly ATPase PilB-like protein